MDSITAGDHRVIVIGAGPVGLCAATELGLRGIDVTLIDPVVDLSERLHPRARIVNLRSTEHLRRWGASDAVRQHSAFGPDWPSRIEFRTSLAGYQIASFDDAFFTAPADTDRYPEPAIQIRQADMEFGLRQRIAALPNVDKLYGHEAVAVTQDEDGVSVTTRSRDGAEVVVRGDYVIGGDGGRSIVRRAFGFEMIGATAISQNLQILFEAPELYSRLDLAPGMQYWCLNDSFPGFVQTTSPDGEFILSLHKLADIDGFTLEMAERAVQAAIGAEVPFRIIGLDPWVIHARIAETYRIGRAFVVGDAARQHSTYGAHGMNIGVGDAADLGWKLAAVIQGWAPDSLLDTFTAERRPVGVEVLRQATTSFTRSAKDLVVPGIDDPSAVGARIRAELGETILTEKRQQFRHIGTQLGYSYAGSSLIVADGSEAPQWTPNSYVPSAVPGSLAPHAWLDGAVSLYDTFGPWFTLLDFGPHETPETDRFLLAARNAGIPVEVVRHASPELADLYGARFALIRPDQHVAWRGDDAPVDGILELVAGRRVPSPVVVQH
jgi:2-polyprenyl-6-methoxyphenol hydroxylase-like FAD-dependent oxidoreductase